MARPLRILYATRNWPGARTSGGQTRSLEIGRILQKLGDVTLLVVPYEPCSESELANTRALFPRMHVLPLEPRPTLGVVGRLRHEFDPAYLDTENECASPAGQRLIQQLLQHSDVAWVRGVTTANLARIPSWGPSMLDFDDLPSLFHVGIAQRSTGLERIRALRSTWIWRRREIQVLDRFTTAAVCSNEDRAYLGNHPKLRVIQNGFACASSPPHRIPGLLRLGMIALMRYAPNRRGLAWFLSDVWPDVVKSIPGVELRLVGDGSDAPEFTRHPNVTGLGWLADAADELSTWTAMVVPIFEGGGTRIKILEAFAREIPLISTSLGAYGYPVQHGRELLLADSPRDFVTACLQLLRSPDLGASLAAKGRELFESHYSWAAIAPAVEDAISACLASSSTPRSPTAPQLCEGLPLRP